MKVIFTHFKKYTVRGFLALIPLVLSYFVLQLLYFGIDQRVMAQIEYLIGRRIPGLGILLLLAAFYFLGLIASNMIGRKVFSLIEKITTRIPIIKTTYQVGKQLSSTLSLPEKQVFKRAVLVDFLTPGIWTVGFVTGTIIDHQNNDDRLLKVYIPTPPNPTSGTIVLVRESQTRDPGWSIDDAMKTVISAGIIGPNEIK
jgi:uncharacterized membrane protein